ncbi:SGNH hydrolase domain-containing protein [Halothiobacillus sp.]|uniref:SGNH hydrolase domain-containing protein n=1 Tax=Halothiobacillus sp. TaxID=1891311 RepID=UPI002AD2B581|nr:SGNH hydrolase domain-containing protein [Halothiobacillus sp.]
MYGNEGGDQAPRWPTHHSLLRCRNTLEALSREECVRRHEFVTDVLRQAEREFPNVTVLDPAPWLCDEKTCAGSRDGMPLYYDEHHLSERGNHHLVRMFANALGPQGQTNGPAGDKPIHLRSIGGKE